jgi:hypothetical protein
VLVRSISGSSAVTHPLSNARSALRREAGNFEPRNLVDAILRRYGTDRTPSVPIPGYPPPGNWNRTQRLAGHTAIAL